MMGLRRRGCTILRARACLACISLFCSCVRWRPVLRTGYGVEPVEKGLFLLVML